MACVGAESSFTQLLLVLAAADEQLKEWQALVEGLRAKLTAADAATSAKAVKYAVSCTSASL